MKKHQTQNGNSKKKFSTGKDGIVRILSPVTAEEIQVVEKERKAKNILVMAIPKEHVRRFHGIDDAKEIWEVIRTRFSGNENSKKMQKAVFKQQLEAFKISSSEGLENGYDRCPTITFISGSSGAEESTARMQINKIPADFADELAIPSFKKSEDGTANTDGKKKRAHSINIKKLRSKDESDGHADNRYGSVNWGGNIPKVEETIHATYASSSKQMSKCRLSWILSSDQSVDPPLRIPETIPKYQRCKATPKDNRKNWNAMMEKNKGQKMAREAEVKKQRVFNTGNGVAKPVWTNANRVNHSNKFLPRSVQLNAGRPMH
ncbi:hypothetical protein Tco_0622895 [Tanacetum coccineum]